MINRRDYFRSYVVVRNEYNLAVDCYYQLAAHIEMCTTPDERFRLIRLLEDVANHAMNLKGKLRLMNYNSTLTMTKEEFALLRLKWEKTRDLRLNKKAS